MNTPTPTPTPTPRTAVLKATGMRRRYAPCLETELAALRARAERAEDNLAALEQCHDDNCRQIVKIADDLATERARLDWVFHNCKVTSDDFTVHDREDLGVAMKEDAK